MFSFYMNRKHGSTDSFMTIGGYDNSVVKGDIKWYPVTSDEMYW